MTGRLLLVSSDNALAAAIKQALERQASVLQVDRLDGQDNHLGSRFQPHAVIVDSDMRSGVHTAFERIAEARRQFPGTPVIALGNEMSAQLVLAALRAGASDFVDRNAGADQLRQSIRTSLAQRPEAPRNNRSRVIGVLSGLPSEMDQDFSLNLAVRIAKRDLGRMALYVDLSLPSSQADVALGLEARFGVLDAIRELGRLDEALLGSALARDPRCGLYVMPLSRNPGGQDASLEAEGFGALLHILRNVFDVIVIGYGPFSRQRPLLEMAHAASLLLCCNQRFSSICAAKELKDWLAQNKIATPPHIVIHEMASGLVPTPADICKALIIPDGVSISGGWDELARHLNEGRPLALTDSSRYCRALDQCLARIGFAPAARPKGDLRANLRAWLNPRLEASTP